MNITPEEARALMDKEPEAVILDVRTPEEFVTGHVPGAVLLPIDQVAEKAPVLLPDKEALILVYCRSGRRSKHAEQLLLKQGYHNVQEFGGILDWPYEVVRD